MAQMSRLASAALLALGVVSSAPAQTVALVGVNNQFGYINLTTRQYTQVSSSITNANDATNIAYDGTSLYITDRTNNGTLLKKLSFDGVASASLSNGPIRVNGNVDEFIGLAYGGGTTPNNGTLYSTDYSNGYMATVNRTNGTTTQLSSSLGYGTEVPLNGKLAFVGPSLYGTINTFIDNGPSSPPTPTGGLYRFDTATGAGTYLGNGGQSGLYTDMIAFGSGSNLYGINGTTLYQINTTNGSLNNLGAITGLNLPAGGFVAAVIAPVPEPTTTLGVAAVGLGLARWVRRRRAARAAAQA